MISLHTNSIRNTVHSVLVQLEIRRSMPTETRSRAVMDDPNGRSFLGLMVWNIGSLIQDTPELAAAFLIAFAISIVVVITKLIGHL